MRHLVAALAGTVLSLGCLPAAHAADMGARPIYTKAPVVVPAPYSWTGWYLGAGGGYGGFNSSHASSLGGFGLPQSSFNGTGGFGTVQVGGDYQFADRWVAGVFGDADFSDIKGSSREIVGFTNFPIKQRDAYAGGARIGYLVTPQILPYVDGGYTHANFSGGSMTFAAPPFAATGFAVPNQNYDGYFLGGGVEVMVYRGWSVKGEYRYAHYDSSTVTIANAVPVFTETLKPTVQTGRLSLVYKFN
jgi:outer membrane immunogenic protein